MTLFFARCRYWNWHQNRSTQTKLRVKSSKLIIDKAVPKTNSAISFFFQENITFHWHFPETLWFRLAELLLSNLLLHIYHSVWKFQKSLILQHWLNGQRWLWMNFIDSMDKDNDGWTSFLFACRYGHQDAVKLFARWRWDIFGYFETLWTRHALLHYPFSMLLKDKDKACDLCESIVFPSVSYVAPFFTPKLVRQIH